MVSYYLRIEQGNILEKLYKSFIICFNYGKNEEFLS